MDSDLGEEVVVLSNLNRFSTHSPSANDIFRAAKTGEINLIQKSQRCNEFDDIEDTHDILDQNEFAPIHYAAKYNKVEMVDFLINNGADINIRGYDELTPLHIAAKYNSMQALTALLNNGAIMDCQDIDGITPIHEAAKLGNINACKEFLERQRSLVNAVCKDQLTPLHLACLREKLSVCELFISNGANIMAKAVDGCLPIHYAAEKGNIQIIKMLISAAITQGVSTNELLAETDNEGQTMLHRATQGGRKESVLLCLQHGAEISSVKKDEMTALHIAAAAGFTNIVAILLKNRAFVDVQDKQGRTALHIAAAFGYIKVINILLDAGANLHLADTKNRSPLLFAVERDQLEATKFLLKKKAEISDVDDQQRNCIHLAASQGNDVVLSYLLLKGGKPYIHKKDIFERIALHYAAEEGYTEVADLLIANGANPDEVDGDANAPLHLACKNGEFTCVKLLCEKSLAQLNGYGARSRTPLHLAVIHNHSGIVELLIRYGADINKRDGSYCTPLDVAADRGLYDVAEILLNNYASVNCKSSQGNTSLHIAAKKGHVRLVELLLSYGGEVFSVNQDRMTCLDLAIENGHKDVAMLIVTQNRAKDILIKTDSDGLTVMQHLVQKLPEVAQVVMDQCIYRPNTGTKTSDYKVTYDFTYIDPGPTFEVGHLIIKEGTQKLTQPNNNALQTMKKFNREQLLNHELSKALIDEKWRTFGAYFYYSNLAIYITYLIFLTYYVVDMNDNPQNNTFTYAFHGPNGPPPSTKSPAVVTEIVYLDGNTTDIYENFSKGKPFNFAIQILVAVFVMVNLSKEGYQMFHKAISNCNIGFAYFKSGTNYLELLMYASALVLMMPLGTKPHPINWIFGSIAIWLSWINGLLFFQRISSLGIYILMLKSVLVTFVKVIFMVIIFIIAFSFVFHMLAGSEDVFGRFSLTCVKVLNMMIGEINYDELFVIAISQKKIAYPYNYMVMVTLVIFMFLMNILLMNLMIALAIGDIDKVQQNANVRRLAIQIGFLDDLERAIPIKLRKMFYKPSAFRKINSLGFKIYSAVYGDITREESKLYQANDEQFQRMFNELKSQREQLKIMSNQLNKVTKTVFDRKDNTNHDFLRMESESPTTLRGRLN